MYDKLLFINDDETDVVCVIRTAEGVKVDEDVWAKFIKIIIIWFICCCWFCSIYINKFIMSDVCDCWKGFILCLFDSIVLFFKMVYTLINVSLICCSLKPLFLISLLIFISMTLSDCLCCLKAWIHSTTARVNFILLWFIMYIFQWFWPTGLSGALLGWSI